MKHIINKMVYSLSAPINKNVVWIKPTGNGTFEMRIYYNNTWVPISSGESGVTEEEYTQPSSPNLVCVYNVTDTSRETQILSNYGVGYFSSMIVDGVEMDVDSYYQFDTTGLHTVEYVCADGTYQGLKYNEVIGEGWLRVYDNAWISLEIPASVKMINSNSSIEGYNLQEIIFHSVECPDTDTNWNSSSTFRVAETGVLKYPKGSDYSAVVEHMAQYHPGWICVEF